MGDPGKSRWKPSSSQLRTEYMKKINKMQSDRVNGKGSAASSSAVPRRGRCSGGACSRSCSPPNASEVEQAGSPQAPIFGRRETSDTPRARVLDRGKSILIAVEDHVGGGGGGGGGGECSYQAPEADSLERPKNSGAVSQGHGRDKKKKKTNDAADTVATSSWTVPGNLFPTTGAAPAERPIRGIRHRNGKYAVEIRVAKKKLLGFDKISLGSYCTLEVAYVARLVGDYYCGKWPPPDCSISDVRRLSSLPPLDPKLPPDEMKDQIQDIARWATAGTVPLWTHPGRGLINAAAAAPVYQIRSDCLDPDTTQQDDFPNTQELQHLPQQRSSHGTAAAGDSQTLEAADQLEAAPRERSESRMLDGSEVLLQSWGYFCLTLTQNQ